MTKSPFLCCGGNQGGSAVFQRCETGQRKGLANRQWNFSVGLAVYSLAHNENTEMW